MSQPLRLSWCAYSTVPVRVRVTPGESGLDLTTVTAASIRVARPDGRAVTWAATIEGTPTDEELVLVHVLVPGDLEALGAHQLTPLLVVPGGTHPGDQQQVQVEA